MRLINFSFAVLVVFFLQVKIAIAGNNDELITDWIKFFFTSWGIPFTIYLILQIGSILYLKGNDRKVALLPLPVMILIVIITIVGYRRGNNLWPIYLIFVSPLAAIFIGIVWVRGLRRDKGSS